MTEKTYIIGLEGMDRIPDPDFTLTYGTPALQRGEELINPVTRSVSNMDRWPPLVEDGMVGEFPHPIQLIERLEGKPVYLLITRPEFVFLFFSEPTIGPKLDQYVLIAEDGPWAEVCGIIFPSPEECFTIGDAVAARIRNVVGEDTSTDMVKKFRRAAKILDPWDGLGQEEYIKQMIAKRKSA